LFVNFEYESSWMFHYFWTSNIFKFLIALINLGLCVIQLSPVLFLVLVFCSCFSTVAAAPIHDTFPNISFQTFAKLVSENFHTDIPLATILALLSTLTENIDLLNLHNRQQYALTLDENKSLGWLLTLTRLLGNHLGDDAWNMFLTYAEQQYQYSEQTKTSIIAKKLKKFITALFPISTTSNLSIIHSVSHQAIQPIHIITPNINACPGQNCNKRSLVVAASWRDIPKVTLIKSTILSNTAYAVSAKCPNCECIYHADHDYIPGPSPQHLYLNSAKYLKIGRSLWADRVFSNSVLAGMYNFHASANAYTAFWNNSFWKFQQNISIPLTRRNIWQAFIQNQYVLLLFYQAMILCFHMV
jgi:uncharacterized C2H2 Zn-finger protein